MQSPGLIDRAKAPSLPPICLKFQVSRDFAPISEGVQRVGISSNKDFRKRIPTILAILIVRTKSLASDLASRMISLLEAELTLRCLLARGVRSAVFTSIRVVWYCTMQIDLWS